MVLPPKEFALKFIPAFRGIGHTFMHERSFSTGVFCIIPTVVILYFFAWPLEQGEVFAITISYGLILALELLNTAIEHMLDRLHPEQHEAVMWAKDASAGAVVFMIFTTVLILGIIIAY